MMPLIVLENHKLRFLMGLQNFVDVQLSMKCYKDLIVYCERHFKDDPKTVNLAMKQADEALMVLVTRLLSEVVES